jgi:hypothetical protein
VNGVPSFFLNGHGLFSGAVPAGVRAFINPTTDAFEVQVAALGRRCGAGGGLRPSIPGSELREP